jgi:putative CocE/NonD family hydrolase
MFKEVMVPMRDGIKLRTRIWKPVKEGSWPVVLERGYWPGMDAHVASIHGLPDHTESFPSAGYVYVGQQTRGSLEGGMFFPDAKDGYDCLDWISKQPWCNGAIAMYGRSFMGATQWLVAPERHPNLKAIVPQCIGSNCWGRGYWAHGALQLAHVARRIYRTETADYSDRIEEFGGWEKFYRHLPLITLDEVAVRKVNRLWKEYVSHSYYDYYWKAMRITDKYDKIKIPVYVMGGWYDNYPGDAFDQFVGCRENGATDEIRIVINPSDHNNHVVGDRDFGEDAEKDELALAIRWLDYVLKGTDNGVKAEPPIKIFVMGENVWHYENEWPLARTIFTKYYFHSDGSKDGWLSTELPDDEPPSSYIYDPDDPVPTLGGNHSSPQDNPDIIRVGAVDQRPNENRDDVLLFTGPTLEEDTEVTGPITVKLYAASSAKDTDFIVRLIDVYPDSTAYNLTEGIIRARFRESIWEPPKPLVDGEIYEYSIELLPTSNVFKRGHRIRVHVTSSNFPLYNRNPNTGHEQGMSAELQVAHQTIFHDVERPSQILLPVIPR